MKRHELSYEELIELAKENYCNGGDAVYECWDEMVFNDYVQECGGLTKAEALEMFRLFKETTEDAMGW